MSFKYIKKIPSADEIIEDFPLSDGLKQIKASRDNEIKNILFGKSNKLILIVGPCSAHNTDAVCEYVAKLSEVQNEVKDRLIIVPRIYTNKPRTTGEGYKGMMHQPDPLKEPNIVEGIKAIRKMHIKAVEVSGLTSADEMLYPENYPYLADILSYVAVGARSVENQQHRLTVSGLDVPAGMKNPISGDVSVMYNAIKAAQLSHIYTYNGYEVKTSENSLTHSILRGSVTRYGRNIPNYHYEDLVYIAEHYLKRGLENPAIIVDTNHSNSGKLFHEQPRIAKEVLNSRQANSNIKNIIKGFMIESFLIEGQQSTEGKAFGQSITDPCLGWDDTERLIKDIASLT